MSADYEQRAVEAEAAARRASTDEERQVHLKVAALWRELAKRNQERRD